MLAYLAQFVDLCLKQLVLLLEEIVLLLYRVVLLLQFLDNVSDLVVSSLSPSQQEIMAYLRPLISSFVALRSDFEDGEAGIAAFEGSVLTPLRDASRLSFLRTVSSSVVRSSSCTRNEATSFLSSTSAESRFS